MADISTVNKREGLKARRDPHWMKLSKGCYLGVRKMTSDSKGSWWARHRNDDGKQEYRALGDFTPAPNHQHFDLAKKAAEDWFRHLGKGGRAEAATVRTACENYVDHLKQSRGADSRAAKDVEARFKAYVYPHSKLMKLDLAKLTPAALDSWRKALRSKPTESGPRRGEQRSDSTLNRDMTCLRAALNLAYEEQLVTSDFAWRGKLLPIERADKRRTDYLEPAQRKKLVDCAAADLADLIRALSLVPIRPGAMAALTVADYDKRLKTLRVGKDKSGADRTLALPDATAKFFAERCKDKLPTAPLLARSNGAAWNKDSWKYPVKDAVAAAELAPSVTAYTLRHSVITDLVNSGLDLLTVAQLSGTSLLMIQRHYGHLTQKQAKKALARLSI